LASIAGAAGILQRSLPAGQRQGECVDIIARECQRLNRLLTNFLDFARPRPPKYETIDLAGLLDSVIALASHAIANRPIALHKDVQAGLAPVECDAELMKQVLLNLLINAFQARPEGGNVWIAACPQEERGMVRIKGEGCGIRVEDRDKIFDPFFTTKENGTGLGLPVAHQIVEQHGGVLTAEANAGEAVCLQPAGRSVGGPRPVSNTGTAPLAISSVVPSAQFGQTNTCGGRVAAGAQCTITVYFRPTGRGVVTGVVTITDNAAGSPHTVSLTGTGTVVSLSAATIGLGRVKVGATSAPSPLTLTNKGGGPLTVAAITIAGALHTGTGLELHDPGDLQAHRDGSPAGRAGLLR
jgi:hypothetical protein